MNRVGTLELEEDTKFQRREWIFERCGWALLGLVICSALAGFFGSGPVASAQGQTEDGAVTVNYSRFARRGASGFLEIRFQGEEVPRRFSIPNKLIETWSLQKVTPQPGETIPGPDAVEWQYDDRGPGLITVEYQPRNAGASRGELRFPGGRSIEIEQFILP